eukprot:c27885_g3_i1 orf=264-2603(+)
MVVKVEVSGDTSDSSFLLELAANNDLLEFKRAVGAGAKVDGVGNWYSRRNGTSQMGLVQKTPAMVASMYGSVEVLHCILNCYMTCGGDINKSCGSDGSTALHCAAAGGAAGAVETVSLLLSFGADLNAADAQGHIPYDVILVSPKLRHVKLALQRLLRRTSLSPVTLSLKLPTRVTCSGVSESINVKDCCFPCPDSKFETATELDDMLSSFGGGDVNFDISSSPSVTMSQDGSTPTSLESASPSSSPKSPYKNASKTFGEAPERTREYPVDPSLPDIKNSIYTTDEFRMFSFKVRPCSRAYSHDWTECPFVHPGENARRRDPRRYHYSCVPCPDFRKGACRRGDSCEYAHGVFECWLHPAQYRTRLCKDGTNCTRRVCFFAHTAEELRPLYISTGSAVPSPRPSSPSDISPSASLTPPASAPSILMVGPLLPSNPGQGSLSTPPMSPSSANALAGAWVQPNIPTLHLPAGLQGSRLRAALNAREVSLEDLSGPDFDSQVMSDFTSFSPQWLSTQARLNAAVAASGCGNTSCRSGKHRNVGFTVAPTSLEDLFASEMGSSPRSSIQESSLFSQLQTHKTAANQVHSPLPSPVLPQVASQVFPQITTPMQPQFQQIANDSHVQNHAILQSPSQSNAFSMHSPGYVSTLGLGVDQHSSSVPLLPTTAGCQVTLSQQDRSALNFQVLGSGLEWSDWGSPTGKPEWGTSGDDLHKYRKSASFSINGSEEPDLSWVQRLVKEGPLETESTASVHPRDNMGSVERGVDHSVLGSLIEQLHLDQIVA